MKRTTTPEWRAIIGTVPNCGPGDTDTARAYLNRIEQALARGGWSYGDRNRLYILKSKWKRRAEGRDPRFNIAGTRNGRLSLSDEIKLREAKERADKRKRKRMNGA